MGKSLDTLKEKALETAQRYIDYSSYDNKESKAIYALKRKCPGFTQEEYKYWFTKAVITHKEAINYIKQCSQQALELFNKNKEVVNLEPMAKEFAKNHPEFEIKALEHTLILVLYWYHLR